MCHRGANEITSNLLVTAELLVIPFMQHTIKNQHQQRRGRTRKMKTSTSSLINHLWRGTRRFIRRWICSRGERVCQIWVRITVKSDLPDLGQNDCQVRLVKWQTIWSVWLIKGPRGLISQMTSSPISQGNQLYQLPAFTIPNQISAMDSQISHCWISNIGSFSFLFFFFPPTIPSFLLLTPNSIH